MPFQAKTPYSLTYASRLIGLRPQDVLAIADKIAAAFGFSTEGFTFAIDFVTRQFNGPIAEARSVFDRDFGETINAATITFNGPVGATNRSGTVAITVSHSIVSVVLQQPEREDFERLLNVVAGTLPPFLASEETDIIALRRALGHASDIAAAADAVTKLRAIVDTEALSVSELSSRAEARDIAGVDAATSLMDMKEKAADQLAAVAKLLDSTKTAHQDVEDKQVKVTAVANNAADLQRRIEEAEQKSRTTVEDVQSKTAATISELQAKSTTTVEEIRVGSARVIESLEGKSTWIIAGFERRTADIVKENEALQNAVKILLQGANAGELFKSFQARKTELERTQGRWLGALAGVTGGVVAIGAWLVYELSSSGSPSASSAIGAVAVKVSVLLPLVVLDVFIANQYSHRRALIEEYAFKSAISLSLLPYTDLVLAQAADSAALNFILGAVEKIYSNPSEAASRPGTMTKEIRRAMKVLQDSGITDLVKAATEKAKP